MKKAYCTLYESPLVPRLPDDLVPHDAGAARVTTTGAMPPCSVEATHAVWYLPVHISTLPVMVWYSLVWYCIVVCNRFLKHGKGTFTTRRRLKYYKTNWLEMAGRSCTILSSGASPPAESPGRPHGITWYGIVWYGN